MKEMRAYLKVGSNCLVGNKVYFFNRSFNGLFYVDLEDFTIHCVHKFSSEKLTGDNLSLGRSIFYRNVIYFFPSNEAKFIMGYDIDKKQEKLIKIPIIGNKPLNVVEVICQEDNIYIFPSDLANGIYIFDLNEQRVIKDQKLSNLFQFKFACSNDVITFHDNHVLVGVSGTNEIIEIDLRTKQIINSIKLREDIQIYSLKFDGRHYWILQTESTDIFEWDKEHNILQLYTYEQVQETGNTGRPYSNIIFLDEEILVLCFSEENILRINKKKRIIGEPIIFPKGFQCINRECTGSAMFGQYTATEDTVLLYPGRGNMMLIYDRFSKKMIGKEFFITEKEVPYLREVQKERFTLQELHGEDNDLETLEGYIYVIEAIEDDTRIEKVQKVGGTILKECLKGQNSYI